ncbi:GGDEF domain-containing protein [Vibrio sp. T187]|uniref:GGDEF domain-containing protein n=2 Tax=Vibrio TaxID=662 RepID=UPI0010CA0234|nr:GGDEF domain-containing protein [Vibrio sp. T187]MBW3698287.1 GGDEF domain-containing protein [Vibrio sp. T187]
MRTYTGFKKLRYQAYFNNKVYLPYAKFVYIPIAMFMAFSITDVIHFGEVSFLPLVLRLLMCLVMIGTAYFCLHYRPRAFQIFEAALLIFSSAFLVYVGRLAINLENYDYQGGLLLVMIYTGTFSRMSARYSLAVLVMVFACYAAGLAPLLYSVDPHHEVESLSIHVSTFILVIAACLRRDLESHKRFSQELQIRKQSFMLRRQAKTFKALSYLDPLTQCHNRLYLHQKLEPSLNHQDSISVYMLDIDHFKNINDTYGHQTGDKVLKDLARELRKIIPEQGHCIRYGGEEFLIIVIGLTYEKTQALGEALLALTRNVTVIEGHPFITVSVGISHVEYTTLSIDQLIDRADQALYESKQNGRNQMTWHRT